LNLEIYQKQRILDEGEAKLYVYIQSTTMERPDLDKIKSQRASGSAFPCIFSDDFRPTIRKAASALHWNICIMFELHGKLQKLEK
jgi:hypothetical protein